MLRKGSRHFIIFKLSKQEKLRDNLFKFCILQNELCYYFLIYRRHTNLTLLVRSIVV